MELLVFVLAGGACIAGALGVVLNSNPVHAALSLVGTLFGIAVLFVAQEASFLAAVQVIVYAGAIVVLFLFVLMLLAVDKSEDLSIEPHGGGQRIAAVVIGLAILALPLVSPYIGDNSGGSAMNRSTTGKFDGPRARLFVPQGDALADLIAKAAIDRRLAGIVTPTIEGLGSSWCASG
jgi:NADH-quinone oxidoreductase subunit J